MNLRSLRNRTVAKVLTRFPSLAKRVVDSYDPMEFDNVPWTPVTKLLDKSRIAIVTTAGVHHKYQTPFDMNDPDGDPSFMEIAITGEVSDLMITHDYYDHSDADRDINIVFPIERLKEFEAEGIIGKLAERHYGFMGHIQGRHVQSLIDHYAPEVARRLKRDKVDFVLLTPG